MNGPLDPEKDEYLAALPIRLFNSINLLVRDFRKGSSFALGESAFVLQDEPYQQRWGSWHVELSSGMAKSHFSAKISEKLHRIRILLLRKGNPI